MTTTVDPTSGAGAGEDERRDALAQVLQRVPDLYLLALLRAERLTPQPAGAEPGYQRPRWTTSSRGRRGRVRVEPLGRSSAAG